MLRLVFRHNYLYIKDMKKIKPNPENGSSSEIEMSLRGAPSKNMTLRLLAIRALISGQTVEFVADFVNVSTRTINNWINRWNEGGVTALADKPKSGRPPAISEKYRAKILQLVDNPQEAGQTHWTAVKLHGFIKKQESIELGYSTLTRWLHNQRYALKVPRPWPVGQDEEAREKFIAELKPLLDNEDLDVWFSDESGFVGDPRPSRVWAKKGSKLTSPITGQHLRQNVIGAVHPRTGALSALVVEYVNSDVFQVFIDQLASETEGRKVILVMDNASWHKTSTLKWRHITPMYLPPYSPDLNPIERLWLLMKSRFFTQWYTKERDDLFDRVFEALKSFMDQPITVKSLCAT